MDPVERHIHSFIVKVWREVVVEDGDEAGWRGYVTHVPSGSRRYFEDLAEVLSFIGPKLTAEAMRAAADEEWPRSAETGPTHRTAASTTDAEPGPEEVEMNSSPTGVAQLQDKLREGDKAVDKAADEATGAQLDLKRKRDAQAALQQAVDASSASAAAIENAVDASVGPGATARNVYDELEKALGTRLTSSQRQDVVQAVKESKDQLAALMSARDQATTKADGLQQASDAAAAAGAAAAAKLATAQGALKDQATAISALTAQVTSLGNAAKSALDAKRPGAADRLHTKLKQALDDLDAAVKDAEPGGAQTAVVDAWTEVAAARDAANTAADALADARTAQKDAADSLTAFQSTAEAKLDERIANLEKQWAAGTTGGSASGGSTTPSAGSGQADGAAAAAV